MLDFQIAYARIKGMIRDNGFDIEYDLCVSNIAKTNQGMETLLSRAEQTIGKAVVFNLRGATYYPHPGAEIRQNHQRYYDLLDQVGGYDLYKGAHPKVDVRVGCGDVKGTVTINTDRKGPLYVATVNVQEIDPVVGRRCALEQKDMVGLFISPKALAPWEHLVGLVGNLERDNGAASLYTTDAEGSKWSLHLAPGWYDYDAPNKGFPRSEAS